MKIYFKTGKVKIRDIKHLLKIGYSSRSGVEFKKTYRDPECTILECHSARRSFGDLVLICKTYFPETTEKEVAKTLFELNNEIGVRASYCHTINKLVFLKSVYDKGQGLDCNLKYSYFNKKGCGNYSYNNIKKLAK
ncbi:MAG: hypothetical protein ACEQSQ_06170 [Candidatus Paceibacteria bacterium]